tara:strand:+ start:82 stop:645 length:564 start_codon:yes stop_codon:yes gene_type:complete
MRIISGKSRGLKLHLSKNKKTRPLKDIARESIFNLLNHSNKISQKVENSCVLDLYAGTGSFGLECLSRRAKFVHFIENEKSTFEILIKNIEKLKVIKKTKIYLNDVFNLKKNILMTKFDIIFCDPPFKDKNVDKLIELIASENLLKKNGIIILHRNKSYNEKLPNYFDILDERIYGISKIVFGKLLS